MKTKWKVVSVNKALQQVNIGPGQPPKESVVWVVTLQAMLDGDTQGGQLSRKLSAEPSFDVGDVLSAEFAKE